MKTIIIICILSAFTIIGFYVNREYWFGWIKPYVQQQQKEIPIGEAYGYQTFDSITSGQGNVVYGYSSFALSDTIRINIYAGFSVDKNGIRKPNGIIFYCGETFIGQIGQAGDSLYCDKCKKYHKIPIWYGK